MTHLLSTLKTSGRAAIIALTLGASVFTAAPAMAQPTPSFSFEFGVGGDGKPSLGFGINSGRPGRPDIDLCLSNRQIIRGLRDEGYRDVQIVSELRRNRVGVVARYGRNWYQMRVNRCTGEVDRIERLRGFKPGIRFQFNF